MWIICGEATFLNEMFFIRYGINPGYEDEPCISFGIEFEKLKLPKFFEFVMLFHSAISISRKASSARKTRNGSPMISS